MIQDRKTYRKKLSSPGTLFLAGEELDFVCQDLSARGVLIELKPGKLINTITDVESVIKESGLVDIFISDLKITGSAKIIWTKWVNNKILLGLEFGEVLLNAQKIWRKRRFFRKSVSATGCLILNRTQLDFECRNISVDGLVVSVDSKTQIGSGMVVEIESKPLDLKGIATVIWVNRESEQKQCRNIIGLRYLQGI